MSLRQNYGAIRRSTTTEERLLPADALSVNHSGDFLSLSARRSALACILLCQISSWISLNAIMLWIPQITTISSPTSDKADEINNMMFVVLGMASVLAGVAMDAWIRKTRVLIVGALIASGGIVSVTIFAMVERDTPTLYFTAFTIILMLISAMESFLRVTLPTLGGDQIPARKDVRLFYAAFYWCQKAGETISGAVYVYILIHYKRTCRLSAVWPAMIFSAAGLSIVAALIVSCSKWIRQVSPDFSVIKDPLSIWKEAFQRRKERVEGEHFMSTAQLSRGGNFPDSHVDDVTRFLKFIVVLVCLLPVMFATNIPGIEKSCYNSSQLWVETDIANCTDLLCAGDSPHLNPYASPNSMMYPLIVSSSALVAIPIIHILCVWMVRKGYPPSLLHRFVAGHVVMVIGNVISFLYIYFHGCGFDSMAVPPILIGLCKAFIYTTGYELTLLSAPRSMQGTAMGLFYLIDGISSLVYMEILKVNIDSSLPESLNDNIEFITGGIAVPVLGLLILVLLETKFNLGLNKH